MLTASKFALAKVCRYWARPDVHAPDVQPESPAATAGTALHSYLEAFFRARKAKAPPPTLEQVAPGLSAPTRRMLSECLGHFMEHRISRIDWVPEQAFAYDPATDTARLLPTKGHRDYSALQPGEVAGTPDAYAYEAHTSTVFVPDWKTGESNEAYRDAAKAQADFNALLVARTFGARKAHVYPIRLTVDGLHADPRELGPADLDRIAAEVAAIAKAIPGAEPVPGLHCRESYCPLVATCPASLRWQAALVPLRAGGAELTFDPQTPEQFATAIYVQKTLEEMSKWLKAAIDAKVDDLPGQSVDLPDGRRYQRSEKTSRSIDLSVPGAEDAIREAGVGEAITPEVTLDRIRQAIRAKGYRGGEVDSILDALLAGLDSLGALVGTPVVSHEIAGRRHAMAQRRDAVPAAFADGSE